MARRPAQRQRRDPDVGQRSPRVLNNDVINTKQGSGIATSINFNGATDGFAVFSRITVSDYEIDYSNGASGKCLTT